MQAIVMHDANAAKHCQQWLHLGDRRKGSAPFLFSFLGSSPPVTWKDIPCHLVYHGRQASCKPPKWATAEMGAALALKQKHLPRVMSTGRNIAGQPAPHLGDWNGKV